MASNNIRADWLEPWAKCSPSKKAFFDYEEGKSYTYQDCLKLAHQTAAYLKNKYKIQKNDRVAVFSENRLEIIVLFFALQRLGAILVPINFRLMPREIEHILNDSGARLLFFEDSFSEMISELNIAELRKENIDQISLNISDEIEEIPFQGHFEDTCKILYTSGTTGSPKGVMLTNKMLFWNSVNTALRLEITRSDVTVGFSPFFHTGGWNVLLTPFIHHGAKTVLLKKFDAEKILNVIEKEKITLFFGVPTTLEMMSRVEGFDDKNLSSVRFAVVGGEPMPIPLIRKWSEKNIPIRQGYGLTEFGPNVFSLNEEHAIAKSGSVGFANFYVETKVVDEKNNEVKSQEIGELLLRGPMCMKGYWQNEDATKETIKDGWLHTGDLVKQDQEGFFYIVGRKKDMFISGGENVYPAEVEKILQAHKGIREVAIVGIPDEKWGEVGKAFVVTEKTAKLSEDDVFNYCKNQLAKFKIPKQVQFLPELPKGDSGKVLKRALQ